jgi:hypothetical protein
MPNVTEAVVTDDLDQQVRHALQRRRRSPIVPASVVVFAFIATAGAYIGVYHGDQFRMSGTAEPAAPIAESTPGEAAVSREEFDVFKRQTADALRSITETQADDKTNLLKLTDDLSALVARIDALQRASAASPPPAPPSSRDLVPVEPVASSRPAVAQRRKPATPKPTGPISVGGAPLPPTSPDR